MSGRDEEHAVIDRLVADLRAVRRLPTLALRLGGWAAVMAVLVGAAVLVPRPDLGARVRAAGFVLETVALATAAFVLGILALRSAEPDRVPTRGAAGAALVLAIVATGIGLVAPPSADATLGVILARAGGCFWSTLAFAAAPALVLFATVRRGAPLAPRAAGAYAAGAALVLASLAMRLHCPLDEAVHLTLGHLLPVAAGTLAGAVLGGTWFGGWRRVGTRVGAGDGGASTEAPGDGERLVSPRAAGARRRHRRFRIPR